MKKTISLMTMILVFFQLMIPSVNGYWASSVSLNAPTPKTSELTLTVGQWTTPFNTYNVTFNSNGGTTISPITVVDGSTFEIPYPTRTNFIFEGWYKETGLINKWTESTIVTQNMTLYAKWNTVPTNSYVVNFQTGEGSTVAPQTVARNNKVIRPADPIREGYSFVGWYKDTSFTTVWLFESDVVTTNTTLYARWMTLNQAVSLIQGALDYNNTNNKIYSQGNIVYEVTSTGLGKYYIKTVNGAYGHNPGDGHSSWLEANALLDYVAGTNYVAGSLVYYNNYIYQATTQTNTVPGSTGWQVKTFSQSDIIIYKELPYVATTSTGLRPTVKNSGWLLITSSWFNK